MEVMYIILAITIAGPVIGSIIGVIKKPSERFMQHMLAFAAGIMLSISFLELIPEGIKLSSIYLTCVGVFIGAVLMYGLDKAIPHINPELNRQEQGHRLRRTATYLLIGIFLHNIPEGMAIALGTVTDLGTYLAIALAIAVHNVPEGICTSAPYYKSTGKRLKSFLISSSTAIPLIIGFIIAKFVFQAIPLEVIGMIAAATAGLMIYISGDELIPTSCNKERTIDGITVFSLIIGVLFVILLKLI